MRKILMAAAMLGIAQGAHAADMPDIPAVLRGALPAQFSTPRVVNWQGFYVGGQYGYGSTNTTFASNSNDALVGQAFQPVPFNAPYLLPVTTGQLGGGHAQQGAFGAFAGYNSQWDDVVIGLEANVMHGDFKATSNWQAAPVQTFPGGLPTATTFSSATMRLNDYGSLRARAGYVWGCFLPYMFGGIGFGLADVTRTVGFVSTNSIAPAPATQINQLNDRFVYGYSAGVGIDINLIGGLFLRAEYEYARITYSADTTVNSVRAGLGYKF